jgi:tol-pal system protein YbgF
MINYVRVLVAVCYVGLLPIQAYAEAPVVDESENYALLDEQQTAYEQPVARNNNDSFSYDEEIPLAKDHAESTRHGDNATLLAKIQGLQQEVQELRGQLEVQSHDLKLLQQQQVTFYKDLDARLRNESPSKLSDNTGVSLPAIDPNATLVAPATPTASLTPTGAESNALKPVVAPVIATSARNNPADEQISYLAAYELIKNKHFDEALASMEKFVTQYPQGGYTSNAQYWLGELYMVKKDYPQAINHFEMVLHQFPSSSKSSASLLKIGYALADSGKIKDAIRRLQDVVKNYPDTNTAQLARAKLESLGSR